MQMGLARLESDLPSGYEYFRTKKIAIIEHIAIKFTKHTVEKLRKTSFSLAH